MGNANVRYASTSHCINDDSKYRNTTILTREYGGLHKVTQGTMSTTTGRERGSLILALLKVSQNHLELEIVNMRSLINICFPAASYFHGCSLFDHSCHELIVNTLLDKSAGAGQQHCPWFRNKVAWASETAMSTLVLSKTIIGDFLHNSSL